MERFRLGGACLLWVLLAAFGLSLTQHDAAGQQRGRRIAVWGSSVPLGTGDETNHEGYTGRLRDFLAPRGWEVLNQSKGGDNTVTIAPRWAPQGQPEANTRYLMTVNPNYVLIGLSLGNERIREAENKEKKDAIFEQFQRGLRGFVDRARQAGITPVITLNYTRDDFTPVEYEYVRRMNILLNSWDVPSVNLLGAVDNGFGRWTTGFYPDVQHPNASGYDEMFHAFVPSLFDALEKGKPVPAKSAANEFARVRGQAGATAPFSFTADETMRAFAASFVVRTNGDGTVAGISGQTLDVKREVRQLTGRVQPMYFDSITLNPSGQRFHATVGLENGHWTYRSANGTEVTAQAKSDQNAWHHVVLSQYTARGETLFFVDGELVGTVPERLEPKSFVVGGPGAPGKNAPELADYKELMIYRAALNADEVKALNEGKLLQASMEIYSPLGDERFEAGGTVENRAQSLSVVRVGAANIRQGSESTRKTAAAR